jgi:hypothetical protein
MGANHLASLTLKRRCPEILANPSFYDDEIVFICEFALHRR